MIAVERVLPSKNVNKVDVATNFRRLNFACGLGIECFRARSKSP